MPRVIGTRCGVNSTCTGVAGDVRERELHLGGVAVGEQPVGGDVLVGLGEEAGGLQPAARAGDAGDGVDHDARRLDQAGGEQGCQRERGRRRVAAGRRDVAGRGDLVAVELGHAEREALEQVGGRVRFAVPLLVGRRPGAGSRRRGR